jgi:S-formylglutathione hydrolase
VTALEVLSEHRCFGGVQGFYRHESAECGSPMRFSVYRPPAAEHGPVPVVYFLAGLTCTEETFVIKAGAQRVAAELGLMLVTPDTSPRVPRLPGDDADWDFGLGAGFYVDATREPWSHHYRMYSYVTGELPETIAANFPVRTGAQGIFGHSMGGHGALVSALRNPGRYRSVSALAPICSPARCPWGVKAFSGYLGDARDAWAEYDASQLVARGRFPGPILIDQGLSDKFLAEQLKPEVFESAARAVGQELEIRRHDGYDHGYYFIASFVADHLRHHARALGAA